MVIPPEEHRSLPSLVKASIHLQHYWFGTVPNSGMSFGEWNGLFTWGPAGNIIDTASYPYLDKKSGPPPPQTT